MNDDTENYIQYLIRTSMLNIVRTDDDVEQFLNNGLLKSVNEVAYFAALASIIL